MKENLQPALLEDPDGPLIEDIGYLRHPSQEVFFPETYEALRRLQEHFVLFIVPNQPGISPQILEAKEAENKYRIKSRVHPVSAFQINRQKNLYRTLSLLVEIVWIIQ